jgi:ADP-heptose:LPS heptosyltransferase
MTRRVVVLRPLGLGDFLTGIPAYRGIRDACPDARITLAASQAFAPLARLSGAVDEVAETRALEPLPRELHHADIAVDLHGKGPASQRILLEARPGRLVSFENAQVPETAGFPHWNPNEHEVRRWCRMLEGHGIPADPSRLEVSLPSASPNGTTIIHPGAAYPARRWPPERWATVARSERDAGRRVLITGGPTEVSLATAVAKQAGLHDAVRAGSFDLLELARLFAAADRVLCGDTGVAHLATALGIPSVVLFGPTSPDLWGPPPNRPWHRVIWKGRLGNPHGMEPDPGLLAITPDDVIAELRALDRLTGVDVVSRSIGR